ncbi:hypothetical protein V8G54_037117 [Vigna mungo]|uniref:Uncharacterized protein n=1 Tax=Vigna mungo TaxID=3915 RepID=A0AAQ3RG49_VIGMU
MIRRSSRTEFRYGVCEAVESVTKRTRKRERVCVKFGGSYGCENLVFYAEERVGMLVEGSWNAATDGESKSVKTVLTYTAGVSAHLRHVAPRKQFANGMGFLHVTRARVKM